MDIETPLLPYRLTICGLTELRDHASSGFSHVVSILDPGWPDPAEFFGRCAAHRRVLLRFDDVVETGRGFTEPSVADVQTILTLGQELRREKPEHVLVHCHAGISRSTAAAITLMVQHHPGREARAFAELARLRPRSWPNSLMIRIADALLAREGALVAALRQHQQEVARAYPEFADLLAQYGRAHEIPGLGDAR